MMNAASLADIARFVESRVEDFIPPWIYSGNVLSDRAHSRSRRISRGRRGGDGMQDIVKKFVEFGLETQNRAVDFLTGVLDKARMEEEEREKFVGDLDRKVAETREKSEKLLKDFMEKVPNPMSFARQTEVEELKQKLQELEERVKALETQANPQGGEQ
jgi:polyhydroxyalkanoate synthesis regulator phasin